jgi:3-deoxy-D-manno-octulosonic-acid transferase
VLLGPHTFNFAQASEEAIAQGAALRVYDASQVFRIAFDLLMERERLVQMSQAATDFAGSSVGATGRTLTLISALTSGRRPEK